MNTSFLIGLDFGTTTCRFILFETEIAFNALLKKSEFSNLKIKFESPIIFTPYQENKLDLVEIKKIVQSWISDSQINFSQIVGGGTLLTGLASRSANAEELVTYLKQIFKEMVIISAQDPTLESWVSGMGATQELMLKYPEKYFINFDIGGGTTNISILQNSKVFYTDCLFIGARTLKKDTLNSATEKLESVLIENQKRYSQELVVTFSGGVGEWVYEPDDNMIPSLYGDLGGEFAKKILESKLLSKNIQEFIPAVKGGATVLGLAAYSTELSGQSIFVSESLRLPIHVPILGTLQEETSPAEMARLLSLSSGSCLQIFLKDEPLKLLQTVCDLLPENLTQVTFLLNKNFAKVFGFLLTQGGSKPNSVCVLDEIPYRKSDFVCIGKGIQGTYPVTLYGGKHELS